MKILFFWKKVFKWYAVTGAQHGSLVWANSLKTAKRAFKKQYNEPVMKVKKLKNFIA